MKLTLEPTNEIATVDGSPARVWIGMTDDGTPVKAFIRAVQPQTHDEAALAVFDRELQALPEPRPGALTVDLRFVI